MTRRYRNVKLCTSSGTDHIIINSIHLSYIIRTESKMPADQSFITRKEECEKPFVDGAKVLIDGQVKDWTGPISDVTSPILDEDGQRIKIGRYAMMGEEDAVKAALAAKKAWNTGRGVWPQMSLKERIASIQSVLLLSVHCRIPPNYQFECSW